MKKVTCPFEKLTAQDLRQVDFKDKSTKKDLYPMLKLTLKGTKRVAILLFYNPSADLEHLNLSFYEVAMIEPMHVAGHIENILTALPHHMRPKDKGLFDKSFSICKAEKERRRCCDWRKKLLVLTLSLNGIDGKVLRLLKTLSEVQRILYLRDDQRTAVEVLRLHNSCFEHYILMKELEFSSRTMMNRIDEQADPHFMLLKTVKQFGENDGEEEEVFDTSLCHCGTRYYIYFSK